jgi:hypothetical protein
LTAVSWPGRARDYSLALPQIRTCPFGASGSSSQGLTIRLATRSGCVDSGLRVLASAECLRCNSLTIHLPFLPRVLAVRVSLVHRYYEGVRLPASLAPRSLPPLGDTTVALAFSIPALASSSAGPGVGKPVPHRENDTVETIRTSQVPGKPRLLLCQVLRLRRDRMPPLP